jgi:hypothetical protein
MKDRVDKSMGIVTRIVETLDRIKPTETLRLSNRESRKKRNWSDSSGNSSAKIKASRFYFLFYYESRKRELKTRLIYEDRCDELKDSKTKRCAFFFHSFFFQEGAINGRGRIW